MMAHARNTLRIVLGLMAAAMAITGTGGGQTPAPPGDATHHLLRKIKLGGEGGWDYVFCDSDARRLYLSRSSHVMVLDIDSGTVIGDIANTNGVHGVAVAREAGRGFTSNGRDSSVTIFDLRTLKPLGSVNVGRNPDAIIYDPASRRVFAFNRGSASVSAIESADGKVAGTIPLGGHPEFAAADGNGVIYVNLDDKSEVVAFDARTLEIRSRWPLAPGEDPSGMAIDREHRRLFVGCGNKKMIVLNADNGRVTGDLPIGEGVDATAFDPGTQLAFSSNGEGTLTVVREFSPDSCRVIGNIPTQRGARTMALDLKTHRVILVTAEFGPPPAPTPERPNPRGSVVPGTFVVLEFGQ